MDNSPPDRSRRDVIAGGVRFLAITIVAAGLGRSTRVAAKAAKSDFMYQEHRHDGKGCGDCRFFTPDGPTADTGACAIVEGVVRRDAWCAAFAPRILA